MFAGLLTFSAHNRAIAFVLVAALIALAALGLRDLQIDASYDSLISESDPSRSAYDETIKAFGSDNTTIVTVRDKQLFTPDKLYALEDLVLALDDLDDVERVDSLFSAISIRDRDGSLDTRPLMDYAPETAEDAENIKSDALYSPIIRDNLLSKDGTVTAINVTVLRDRSDPNFNNKMFERINAVIAETAGKFDAVDQIGPPRLNVEIEHGMFADLSKLTPLSMVVLMVSIMVLMRVPVASLIPLITAGLSILLTLGFMGFADLKLTLLTAIIPSLIIVIGSTEDMHLISAYLEGLGAGRKVERNTAVKIMAKHTAVAVMLTGFTTAAGFASNAINDIPLIRDFAMASAFGIVANFIVTVLLVPALLSLAGPRQNPLFRETDAELKGIVGFLVPKIEIISSRYGRAAAVVTALISLGFGVMALKVHVSNDPLSYFPDDHKLVRDAESLHNDLSGMQIFYLTLDGGQEDAFRSPENLLRLQHAVTAMRDSGHYDKITSITDHLSLVNQEMFNADPARYAVPDTRQLVDQYLILFQRSDIDRYITADGRRANVVVRHNISDSHALNGILTDLAGDLPGVLGDGIRFELTGENLMINRAAEGLFVGQVQSLILIGGIVFVLMSFLYTSFYAGGMFLIPNFFPLVMNFGVMGLLGIPLNPGTATVAAIALGVAVDDSIHLFTRFREEVRESGDPEVAARKTVRNEAVAVITTSLSLMIMFATMLSSEFAIVAQFGLLAALTMVFALIADLVLTPIVLQRVGFVGVFELATLKLAREVIAGSPLFADMTPMQVKKTVLLSQTATFQPGETIFSQGDMGDALYVVLSGDVDIYFRQSDDEDDRHINRLGPGQTFGEIAFVTAGERSATVKASAAQVDVMVLNPDKVAKTLRSHPRIAQILYRNIGRILGQLVITATERAANAARDADQKSQ